MKNKLVVLSIILFSACLTASAQIYVKIRPVAPVVVITERPGPNYVWVAEEWNVNGGNYSHVGGYWVAPPSPGAKWYRGYWYNHKGHGNHWVPGRWKGKKEKKK